MPMHPAPGGSDGHPPVLASGTSVSCCSTPSRSISTLTGALGFLEIASMKSREKVAVAPSTRRMTSDAFRPSRSAGEPGRTEATCGCESGRTPISPTSKRVWGVGVVATVNCLPLRRTVISVARSGTRAHADEELLPGVDVAAAHAHDEIAGRRPALSAGDPAHDLSDDGRLRLKRGNLGAVHQHAGRHDHGQDEVHQRAHDENLEPLPLALRQELVVAARSGVVGILARHLHVAAKRNRADHVFGVTALEADEPGAEARAKI